MLFTEDIVLVSKDDSEIQQRQIADRECWLEISRTKTEYMSCDFGGIAGVSRNGTAIPACTDFKYLSELLQNNGKIDRSVQQRINAGCIDMTVTS